MPAKKKVKKKKFEKLNFLSFQDLTMNLQKFWGKHGCVILQPYDMEVGAGTFHPATTLRSLGPKPWKAAYVQPSRRPTDGRYGENPNRLQHYYQYQVIIKPSPKNIKQLYLKSLAAIGIDVKNHDIRFVEDDWESPTLGAAGLGWEVWCDGMEITQFTYFQQMTAIECKPVPVEITYGLERLCMFVQGVNNVKLKKLFCSFCEPSPAICTILSCNKFSTLSPIFFAAALYVGSVMYFACAFKKAPMFPERINGKTTSPNDVSVVKPSRLIALKAFTFRETL